jgi:copper homeostasis protein (lipoprotein)
MFVWYSVQSQTHYFMNKNTFLIVAFLGFFIGCQKQAKGEETANDSLAVAEVIDAKNTLNYQGSYKGILPCADCEGIETTITLNENSTYAIRTMYLGKGHKVFEQKGTFSWNKQGSEVVFDNIGNAPNRYLVTKNKLTQMDMSGKAIIGNHAADYVLLKQKVTIENGSAVHELKDTVNLNNKMAAQTIIKRVNPAVGKVALAETKWKLTQLYSKQAKQTGKKIYFLKLNSKDGKFTAYAGCNNIAGNYAMPSASSIAFMNTLSTKMMCENIEVESQFLTMLTEVDRYTLVDNILRLKKGKKEVLATFEPLK